MNLFDKFNTVPEQFWTQVAAILYLEKMPMTSVVDELLRLLDIDRLAPTTPKDRGEFYRHAIFLISTKAAEYKDSDLVLIEDTPPSTEIFIPKMLEPNCLTKTELQLLTKNIPDTHNGLTLVPSKRRLEFNSSMQLVVRHSEEEKYFKFSDECLKVLWDLRSEKRIVGLASTPIFTSAYDSLCKKLITIFGISKKHWTKNSTRNLFYLKLLKFPTSYAKVSPEIKIDKSKLFYYEFPTEKFNLISTDNLKALGVICLH